MPIEPGWRYAFISTDEEAETMKLIVIPVIAWGLVESYRSGCGCIGTRVEPLVHDGYTLVTAAEFVEDSCDEKTGILLEPGEQAKIEKKRIERIEVKSSE